ncbi:MAG TPA: hypothetical protein DDY49_00240 [Paenibacillaceae bacterium]|nr:hypothetical protein [Paenibacillaceae bacterium]
MNPGYFTYLCIFILYILLWMNWLTPFLQQMQISEKTFALLLTMYLVFSFVVLPYQGSVQINVGIFVFPALLLYWAWGKEGKDSRIMIVSSFLLVGVNLFLLRYIIRIDPVLLVIKESYLCAFIAIISGLILAKSQKDVFLILGSGLYLMELLFQWWSYTRGGEVYFGDGMFSDIFLLSLLGGLLLRRAFEWVMSCLSIRFHL